MVRGSGGGPGPVPPTFGPQRGRRRVPRSITDHARVRRHGDGPEGRQQPEPCLPPDTSWPACSVTMPRCASACWSHRRLQPTPHPETCTSSRNSLAYFERPNADVILSTLHDRAAVAPPARRQEAEIAETVAERSPRASSPEPRAPNRRRLIVPAAAAILLLAVTGGFLLAGSRNGRLASVVEGLKSTVAAPAEATTTATPESPADTTNVKGTRGAGAAQDHGRWHRDREGATQNDHPRGVSAASRFRSRGRGRRHGS